MTFSVNFPQEIESVLRQRAALIGKDVETLIQQIVTEEVTASEAIEPREESHRDFMQRLDTMIQRHGIRNGKFDDRRQSIYPGRDE